MAGFGKRAKDRPSTGGGGDYFLKTFKEKHTKIRFLIGNPNDFIEIREHFDKTNKMSYPCAKHEGADACVGCDYPVNHPEWDDLDSAGLTKEERRKQDPGWSVREVGVKFIFPALDEKGYINVYKIGWNFFKSLRDLYELIKDSGQDLTTVDYAVIRSGENFNDISYQAQAISGPYERKPKTEVPTDERISSILGGKYKHAMETYGYDTSVFDVENPGVTSVDESAPEDPAPLADGAADPSAALPPAEPVEVATPGDVVSEALAAAKNAKAEAGLPGPTPGEAPFNPAEAGLGEIKDFLDSQGVTYAPKAPRQVLVALAKAELDKAPAPY